MTTNSFAVSRQLLVSNLLSNAAHNEPNKVALKYEDKTFTYQQLEAKTQQLAAWIQAQGIQKDAKVAFMFKNSADLVEILWAVTYTGGVGVPLNFRLTGDELTYILNNSDAEMLFVDAEFAEQIAGIEENLPNIKTFIVAGEPPKAHWVTYGSIFETAHTLQPVDLTDDDACLIIYTSGTTGLPKGAVLTHKNIVMNAQNAIHIFDLVEDSVHIVVAPIFHVAASATLFYVALARGTTIVQRDFNPVQILQTIERERVTSMFLVPAMWNFVTSVPNVADYDLSSITHCIAGAETCPVILKEKIQQVFGVEGLYEAFGQTETSPVTIAMSPKHSMRKSTSLGRPIINVETRIVDDEMNDVPLGEVGEIVYRGPTVMKEYYKRPEETAAAFEGGWFHSGDLVSADEEGFIYIRDRKKDMIITGGENVYPAEIEGVLYRHEAIFEAAVVGVPDEKWGESIKAFVVLHQNATLTEQEVIDYCQQHLASYKKPKYVEFIDVLPRNTSGKILKRQLREISTAKA